VASDSDGQLSSRSLVTKPALGGRAIQRAVMRVKPEQALKVKVRTPTHRRTRTSSNRWPDASLTGMWLRLIKLWLQAPVEEWDGAYFSYRTQLQTYRAVDRWVYRATPHSSCVGTKCTTPERGSSPVNVFMETTSCSNFSACTSGHRRVPDDEASRRANIRAVTYSTVRIYG
jgi:hypothetical protein